MLSSTLSTPFQAAPPSQQLLGPSVKFTLPLICGTWKSWCQKLHSDTPAGDSCERHENVRQRGKQLIAVHLFFSRSVNLSVWLSCFFLFFFQSIPSQKHSVWACQIHDIAFNNCTFSFSFIQCSWFLSLLLIGQGNKLYYKAPWRLVQVLCDIQLKLWVKQVTT